MINADKFGRADMARLHGLKTSGKRVLCIKMRTKVYQLFGISRTRLPSSVEGQKEERRKAIDYKTKKVVIRRKPWGYYEHMILTVGSKKQYVNF
jgi:hypothetical protein